MSGVDDTPQSVVACLDDGIRPHPDPNEWSRLITVQPGKACPDCGTAIGLVLAPPDLLGDHVDEWMADYPVSVPDGWVERYDHPVYLYCDNPMCTWQGGAEWYDIAPILEAWIQSEESAPTWRDRVNGRGNA